jgi:hypothetical protein
MQNNILAIAAASSDHELLARLDALAGNERAASVELVAHLAALDARPALHAEQGFGSLFSYCTQALHLSEDAACNRIEAARACRRCPVILDHLASGALSLTFGPPSATAPHVRESPGGPREGLRSDAAWAPADAAPPRDPRRRSGRDLRPCRDTAPGEGREGEAGRGHQAQTAAAAYPSRDG